jgi:3-hydroxybutyryl-CoA dehydrogenase
MSLEFQHVAIIGAGAMGRGIAQVAAQAGSQVWLLDTQAGAAQQAREALGVQWDKLQAKGKCSAEQVQQWRAALHVAGSVSDLATAELIVEAVVERLDVKQALFAQLEEVASPQAVLVSNTSSLSIAAIAANLRQPGRVAGYHFFNPVPLMRVVEVVASVRTDAEVVERLVRYAQAMGHQAVVAQDTPGFIVNHAGRGYGTEALRLLGEGVCDVATTDRILRDQAGFRLGPFELFDLTGLDVSHPVMESIYQQYYAEPRYRPSVITAQRLAAGLVGRKKGQGFYRYVDNQPKPVAEAAAPSVPDLPPVWVSPKAARRAELLQWLKDQQLAIETGAVASPKALIVVAPLGFDVTTLAAVEGLDASRTVGIDLLLPDAATKRRVVATNPATRQDMRQAAHALFARDGKPVSMIRDSAGFVTQRVLAAVVNIASDICQQDICSPADLDLAVSLGLGYPSGPLAWGDALGPNNVLEILFNMQTVYGDPRYRPSPWLRRRAALGLSLLHTEA